jgi:hypothetical protein
LDRYLAPFPLLEETYATYLRLTRHLSPALIRRILPDDQNITTLVASHDDVLSIRVEAQNGFTKVDLKRSYPKHSTAQQITMHSIDKSWLLQHLLDTVYDHGRS